MRGRLDSIDWAILKELQADGSITNVELARRVGLSAPPCLRRVRALEKAGIIKAYRAMLDPKALGYEIVCFAMVQSATQGKKRTSPPSRSGSRSGRSCANAGNSPATSTSS